jgi:ribonuclease Z
MIRTIVLGIAGSAPTRERHLPSIVIVREGDMLMFDCGEGTQFQLLNYGLNAVRIKAIFLSHAHGDHTIGIAGLVRTMALNSRKAPLYIFVPEGYEKMIHSLIIFDRAMMTYPIIIKGVKQGVVYRGKGYQVSAFRLNHSIPTYGYVFKEDDRLRFITDKAKKAGLKGTMFSELQAKGSITIKGKKIKIGQLTTPQAGKKIAYAADSRPTAATVAAVKGADLLIHEASYSDAEEKLAVERKHSTAAEAAEVAKKAGVKRLLLTHISARHKDTTEFLKEAKRIFPKAEIAKEGEAVEL